MAQTRDWIIVASTPEAAMGVHRSTLRHDGRLAYASVLMGTFRPETFADGSVVHYYISKEEFDCEARSRTERSVLMFGPSANAVGPMPDLETDYPVRPGSIYENILIAVCDGVSGLGGGGYDRPLDAIEGERTKRLLGSLPVTD